MEMWTWSKSTTWNAATCILVTFNSNQPVVFFILFCFEHGSPMVDLCIYLWHLAFYGTSSRYALGWNQSMSVLDKRLTIIPDSTIVWSRNLHSCYFAQLLDQSCLVCFVDSFQCWIWSMFPWMEFWGIPCDVDLRNLIFWKWGHTKPMKSTHHIPSLGSTHVGVNHAQGHSYLTSRHPGKCCMREGAFCATQTPTNRGWLQFDTRFCSPHLGILFF